LSDFHLFFDIDKQKKAATAAFFILIIRRWQPAGSCRRIREMRQRGSVSFPVLSVKFFIGHFVEAVFVNAAKINTDAVGIRARHVPGLNTAGFTKVVPGNAGIKCVQGQLALIRQQSKMITGNNQMLVSNQFTNGTIAEIDQNLRCRFKFKCNRTAMTGTRMQYGFIHGS